MNTIHKAGGIILKDRRLLVTRSFGKDIFIAPGGKLEADETPELALRREMFEELTVTIVLDTLEHIGTFYAEAAGQAGVQLRMDVYIINDFEGELSPSSEVEELMWINTQTTGVAIGSIFEHDVMPLLKQKDLID
jgi:8-oxo-dGTP pyrophosphatase MutT (NUDIX family)